MFILDTGNYRILKWKSGEPLGSIVAGSQVSGSALSQISTSYAMFIDSQYNIYVSEYGNHRITKWSAVNTTAGILVYDILIMFKYYLLYHIVGGWWQWSW